ncbi:hypothetical protein KI387_019829, partial [Taxus chinensis]
KNEDQELAGISKPAARWRQIEDIHNQGENYEEVPCMGNSRYYDILPSFIPLPYSYHNEGLGKEASDKCIVKANTRKTKEHGGKVTLEFSLHADLNSEFLSVVRSILSMRDGTHHQPRVKNLLHDQRDTMLIKEGSMHQHIGKELPRRLEPNKARTSKIHKASMMLRGGHSTKEGFNTIMANKRLIPCMHSHHLVKGHPLFKITLRSHMLTWNECYSFDPGIVTQLSLKRMIESNQGVRLWCHKLAITGFYAVVLKQQSHHVLLEINPSFIVFGYDASHSDLLQQSYLEINPFFSWMKCYENKPFGSIFEQQSYQGRISLLLWAICARKGPILASSDQQYHPKKISLISWLAHANNSPFPIDLVQQSLKSRFPLCHHVRKVEKDPRNKSNKGPLSKSMEVEMGGLLFAIICIPFQLEK